MFKVYLVFGGRGRRSGKARLLSWLLEWTEADGWRVGGKGGEMKRRKKEKKHASALDAQNHTLRKA